MNLVSIIVPVYIQDNTYLKQCVTSLLNQTHKNIEVIIVDDGMKEDNINLLNTFTDSRLSIIKNNGKGVCSARNTGIAKSSGDYLVFVDSDDYIDLDYIEKMLLIAESADTDITVCMFKKIYKDHEENSNLLERIGTIPYDEYMKMCLNVQLGVGFMWGKVWKASFIKENALQLDESLVVAEDAKFCIDACNCKPNVYIMNETLYNYRVNENSVSKKYNENYLNNYLNAMNHICDSLRIKNDENINTDFYNFVAYHLLMICVNYSFNEGNQLSYRKQKNKFLNQIKGTIFEDSIRYSTFDNLSISRKIPLFCLKKKCYLLVKFICIIRNKQTKK